MGYHTSFCGHFDITPPLSTADREFLVKFGTTRRMKRKGLHPKYGVDGEFYVDGGGFHGQDQDPTVVGYNDPPSTQPGLWCQWIPNADGSQLVWDEGEKFYQYIEWLKYLVEKILKPRGYTLNGEVEWEGEEHGDFGKIVVKKNQIATRQGKLSYGPPDPV